MLPLLQLLDMACRCAQCLHVHASKLAHSPWALVKQLPWPVHCTNTRFRTVVKEYELPHSWKHSSVAVGSIHPREMVMVCPQLCETDQAPLASSPCLPVRVWAYAWACSDIGVWAYAWACSHIGVLAYAWACSMLLPIAASPVPCSRRTCKSLTTETTAEASHALTAPRNVQHGQQCFF